MSIDNNIDFKDHIVQYPNRFKQTTVGPGIVELVPTWIETPEQIIQPGTPVDSELFKKLKQNVTIYQQTFTTTTNQTIINLDRNFLVGQNRVSLSIGGVRQYAGQDYTETDTHTLTMASPLKGGLKAEVIIFTASQVIAEDFFEKTLEAIAATQAANNAAAKAETAATTAFTIWKAPVANFAAIATTYPTPAEGWTVQTLDDLKVYRRLGSTWTFIQQYGQESITPLIADMTLQKTVSRNNKADHHKVMVNPSLISKPNAGNYNLMQSQDFVGTNFWFTKSGIVTGEKIVVNGVELTKFTTNNYYNSLSSRTKNPGNTLPLVLDPTKKYLCSAYCMTYDTPRFFYHKSAATGVNEAVYVDNQLRRFWFIVNGDTAEIYWYQQGNSGYNVNATNYTNNIYMGGFQIEEIPATKNGIAFMGDSTVQGAAGTNDTMSNTEWVKMSGSILNVSFFNRGIGGNTTANMIARWGTDITPLASVCKYVVILGGINDLGKAGTTAQTILDAHRQMHTLAITDGLTPIHCNITPCGKTGTDEQVRKDANALLKTEYGSLLLDLEAVTVDLYEANKLLQIDNWKGDDVHYAQLAKDGVAQYIASRLFWNVVKPSVFKPYS